MSDDVPVWTDSEHRRELAEARKDETERCARLCEELAMIHTVGAARDRKEGEYTVRAIWPFGKIITLVKPRYEQQAKVREAAVHTMHVLARCMRAGYDARKPVPDAKIDVPKPDVFEPCPECSDPMDCASWKTCLHRR